MPKDGRRIQISLRLRSSQEVKHLAFKYAVCSLPLPCLHSLVSMRAKCKQKYVKFDCHITSTKYNSVDILDFNKTKLAKFWPYLWLPQRILQTLTNKIDCTSISRDTSTNTKSVTVCLMSTSLRIVYDLIDFSTKSFLIQEILAWQCRIAKIRLFCMVI